jgi:hypothetical protein
MYVDVHQLLMTICGAALISHGKGPVIAVLTEVMRDIASVDVDQLRAAAGQAQIAARGG